MSRHEQTNAAEVDAILTEHDLKRRRESWRMIEEMVKKAPKSETCHNCNGKGEIAISGYVLNGRFVGKVGPCFRCAGKGFQTPEDVRRNGVYDCFHRRVHS